MKKQYIRVKVRGITYRVSQVTGKIYYFSNGEKFQSKLVSLKKCDRILDNPDNPKFWRARAMEFIDSYNYALQAKNKKHPVDVF